MENSNGQSSSDGNQNQDRYRIITKLESGGMADIYLGVQLGEDALERLVVIKKIRARGPQAKQAMGMFLDEARVVASLNHPHIVQIYDLSRVRSSICITMEYIDGENLAYVMDWLKKHDQTVPLAIACRLILQACEALQYAHTAKSQDGSDLEIIHRDIDLRNIMINSSGYLKIIDFGVAKAATQVELTAPTMFKGKLSYSAPETFSESSLDSRADVYALGLVFHQILTGHEPFPFKPDVNLGEVINRICNEEIPSATSVNGELPEAIDALISKAIDKDRENRFQSAGDFATAIREFAESEEKCGSATPEAVKDWFNSSFEKRTKQRRKFEQKVIKKARMLAEKAAAGEYVDESSLVPAPPEKKNVPIQSGETGSPEIAVDSLAPPTASAESLPSLSSSSQSVTEAAVPVSSSSMPLPEGMPTTPSGPTPTAAQLSGPAGIYPNTPSLQQLSQPMYGQGNLSQMTHAGQMMPPPKRINPYALVGTIFGGVLVLLVFVYWLFIMTDEPIQEVEVARDDVRNLFVVSSPADADVFVDGRKIGTTGSDGISIKITSGEMHNLKVAKSGYEAYESVIWGKNSGIHRTEAVLVKTTTVASAPDIQESDDEEADVFDVPDDDEGNSLVSPWPQNTTAEKRKSKTTGKTTATNSSQQPPEKPAETKPADISSPTPAPAGPDTSNWYSGDGNWSGAAVAARGCTKCHARGISPMSRTDTEWIHFFIKGQYRKYANLNKYFSKKELGRVMVYIVKKRRQSDKK
ncbi:MAG: protein kinase [Proteobacteria bacterium]|nr:protein kinase [Pseudomonadota bacterium]